MKLNSKLLRSVAYDKGITQKAIATKTGLSVFAVFQAFNDKKVRESTARKVCGVLDLKLKDVVVFDED